MSMPLLGFLALKRARIVPSVGQTQGPNSPEALGERAGPASWRSAAPGVFLSAFLATTLFSAGATLCGAASRSFCPDLSVYGGESLFHAARSFGLTSCCAAMRVSV